MTSSLDVGILGCLVPVSSFRGGAKSVKAGLLVVMPARPVLSWQPFDRLLEDRHNGSRAKDRTT